MIFINNSECSSHSNNSSGTSLLYFLGYPLSKIKLVLLSIYRFHTFFCLSLSPCNNLDTFSWNKVRCPDSCEGTIRLRNNLRFFSKSIRMGYNRSVAKDWSVEIMFPLFMRIFSWECNRFFSCNIIVITLHVHVPHSNDKVAELNVSLNLSIYYRVILNKVLKRYNLLIFKTFICTVETSK